MGFVKRAISIALVAILSLGLVALPLVYWPWAKLPYELPKVWFLARLIEVLAIFTFIKFVIHKSVWRVNGTLLVSVLSFVLVATGASLLGTDFIKSLVGNYYRGDGLVTLYHLVAFAISVSLLWDKAYAKWVPFLLALGSFIAGILSLFSGSGVTFGNPNFLAGYLTVTLPFLFFCLKESSKNIWRAFWVFGISLQVIAIFNTGSYGAIVSLFVVLTAILVLVAKKQRFALFILGLLATLTPLFFWFRDYRSQPVLVAEGRERVFRKIVGGTFKKPLLGYGLANADHAFEAYEWPIKLNNDIYVDKAHSQVLEVFATTGVFGLVVYLFMVGIVCLKLAKKIKTERFLGWNTILLVTLLTYLVHSQTNVTSIAEEAIFWFVVGLAL